MAFVYKIDVLAKLKEKGYTQYRIGKEKIFGQRNITQLKKGEIVSLGVLNKLCELLECDIGDIIEYIPEEKKKDTQ